MSEKTYSWKKYRESEDCKKDKERIFNNNALLDSFDRHIEESGTLSYRQLTTPFNV